MQNHSSVTLEQINALQMCYVCAFGHYSSHSCSVFVYCTLIRRLQSSQQSNQADHTAHTVGRISPSHLWTWCVNWMKSMAPNWCNWPMHKGRNKSTTNECFLDRKNLHSFHWRGTSYNPKKPRDFKHVPIFRLFWVNPFTFVSMISSTN